MLTVVRHGCTNVVQIERVSQKPGTLRTSIFLQSMFVKYCYIFWQIGLDDDH